MPTPIFTQGLELFVEAEEHGGVNGSAITIVTDLSTKNRDLSASANHPTVKTGAINSKRSFNFDGTNDPLCYEGDFRLRCGFMVFKVNDNFDGAYEGILTSPENYGILVGNGGGTQLFNFEYNYYEYRLNDRIYVAAAAPAPKDDFGIVYFKFWTNLTVEGIQIGQDRNDAARKFNGEIAMLALYDRDFCEADVRKQFESIAFSHQIPIADVFPYQGMKSDSITISKRVLSDGQDEPVTRIKRGAQRSYDLTFAQREQAEYRRAEAFWNAHHPNGRFFYRDYQHIPPEDIIVRLPEDSTFNRGGAPSVNFFTYSFQAVESKMPPAYSIPSAPVIPDEQPPVVVLVSLSPDPIVGVLTLGGTVTDIGSVFLQLFLNGVAYGPEHIIAPGAFSLDVLLDDLESSNTFFVTARDSDGNVGISNEIFFNGTPDPYPPSVPVIKEITGKLTSEFLVSWYPAGDEEAFGAEDEDDFLLV